MASRHLPIADSNRDVRPCRELIAQGAVGTAVEVARIMHTPIPRPQSVHVDVPVRPRGVLARAAITQSNAPSGSIAETTPIGPIISPELAQPRRTGLTPAHMPIFFNIVGRNAPPSGRAGVHHPRDTVTAGSENYAVTNRAMRLWEGS